MKEGKREGFFRFGQDAVRRGKKKVVDKKTLRPFVWTWFVGLRKCGGFNTKGSTKLGLITPS